MIGKYQIELGANEYISGMASSDYAPDGGLGISSKNLNAIRTPGYIQATAAAVDASTNVADNIIASCEHNSSAGVRLMVGDAANFYSFDGTTATKKVTGTATTNYVQGITDMVEFAANYISSQKDNLTLWNGNVTINETWWTTTLGQTALSAGFPPVHPLLVYNRLLWVGDASKLHSIAEDLTTVVYGALSLSSDESILALGVDPASGQMLISTSSSPDTAAGTAARYFVYLFDGVSTKPTRKIPVDAPITCFRSVGGQVFVAFGQSVGIWTGNGVQFLRRLKNVALTKNDLMYKHHITNIRNFILYVDGTDVICYGEVVTGKKVFTPITSNPTNSNHLSMLTDVGNNKIALAFGTNKLSTVDLSSGSAGSGSLYFNNAFFPRPVYIRRIRVITGGVTSNAGIGQVGFIDDTFTNITAAVNTFICTATRYIFDYDFNKLVTYCQPFITLPSAQAIAIIRIIVYYDVAE